MNFIKKVKPLAILSIFLLFTFHSYAQFVENVKKMVTRKAQITVLNTTIDSLKSEAKNKDSALQEEQEQTHDLNVQLTDLNTKLEQSEKKNKALEKEISTYKKSLDSLHQINLATCGYTKEQRTEDSLHYQNLLRRLSEQSTYVIDSLSASYANKKQRLDPTKIENYYFKNFKSVITGIPDSKNRYTWTFELYKKDKEEYVPAKNQELFNDKKQELLAIINAKIQKEFNIAYKTDSKCFTSKTTPVYDFGKLGIEFQDEKMNFYAIFDFTNDNCKYLYGYTSVEFSADEIAEYLN